jgi:hypothetical protein
LVLVLPDTNPSVMAVFPDGRLKGFKLTRFTPKSFDKNLTKIGIWADYCRMQNCKMQAQI